MSSQLTEKNRQNVATDNRRIFTDKDKVRHIQTLGNDNRDAMLDCKSGFHQREEKRKLNCHKLRSSYVMSTLITKLTFAMFLLKLSTLSTAIFSLCFISLVSFMREINRSFSLLFFFQYSLSDVDIRH